MLYAVNFELQFVSGIGNPGRNTYHRTIFPYSGFFLSSNTLNPILDDPWNYWVNACMMKFISVFMLVAIFILSINAASTFLDRRTKPPYFPSSPPSCPICEKVRARESSGMCLLYTYICASSICFLTILSWFIDPLSLLYWRFRIHSGLSKYQLMCRGCTSLGQFLYGLFTVLRWLPELQLIHI